MKENNPKNIVIQKRNQNRVRCKIKQSIIDTYCKEKLDGSLHVSSHHVLLHVPIGVFSTHAMGDQRMYNERGLMHATVDAETASTISGEEFTNYTK